LTSLALSLILFGESYNAAAKDQPLFRAELKQFGPVTGHDYSSVGFLSDDLLLVLVAACDEPCRTDGTLLVFDVSKKQAVRNEKTSVKSRELSIVPLTDGNFLVRSSSEVKLCSAELRCEKSLSMRDLATPLTSETLRQLDGANDLTVRRSDTSSDGSRIVNTALDSTLWNKISHPLDIDAPASENVRRISVYEMRTGKTLFAMHYNPKNSFVLPALSPNGTRLAILRKGSLEVYGIP